VGHFRIEGGTRSRFVFVPQQQLHRASGELLLVGAPGLAVLARILAYLLAGIPADLAVLLQDAYTRGARIHSNSWGGGDPGAYDAQCEQLDRFVWQHKDMCVLFAAGNDGTDKDGDGVINPMSVTSPGTAKNCITVGASENDRGYWERRPASRRTPPMIMTSWSSCASSSSR